MPDTSPFTKFLRAYRKSEAIFKERTLGSVICMIHAGIVSSRVIITNVMSSKDLSKDFLNVSTIGLRTGPSKMKSFLGGEYEGRAAE